MNTVVGVDGCRAGWFWFRKDLSSVSSGTAHSIEELARTLPIGSKIFIDIPIGLIESGSGGRACDLAARKALGFPRATSVFSAPARPVLGAEDYEEAKRLSQKAIGKKLSKQSYLISSKIFEVDEYLCSKVKPGYEIREIHPEVCFWAFNGRKPMRHSKKRSAGFEERMNVLAKRIPDAQELVDRAMRKYKRSQVAKDDILDALVAMIVASTPEKYQRTLPSSPPKDSRGLRMEIVYAEGLSS